MLNPSEKTEFKGLIKKAFKHADSFTGTEAENETLLNSLISIENFVSERMSDSSVTALEEEFSKQCGIHHISSIDEFLKLAINRAWGFLNTLSDEKHGISQLGANGVVVLSSDLCFLPPDAADDIPFSGNSSDSSAAIEFQPRLASVLEYLHQRGIYTDDVVIRTGKAPVNSVRQLPYTIVEIPRLNAQIAVCDQYGAALYISKEIMPPHIWATKSKSQLRDLANIRAVNFDENWKDNITSFLSDKPGAKVDIQQYARRVRRTSWLSISLINESARETIKFTGKRPHDKAGEVLYGPLAGDSWKSIDSSIRNRGRGLDQENLPDDVRGLASYFNWQGIKKVYFIPEEKQLTPSIIEQAIKEHQTKYGDLPTRHSGEIKHGILKGEQWKTIDSAIHKRARGLDQADIPESVKGLASFQEHLGLKISKHSSKKTLTVSLLVDTIDQNRTADGEIPSFKAIRKLEIAHGPLKGERWDNINGQISKRYRGLQDAGLPQEVKGLTSFVDWAISQKFLEKNSGVSHNKENDIGPAPDVP